MLQRRWGFLLLRSPRAASAHPSSSRKRRFSHALQSDFVARCWVGWVLESVGPCDVAGSELGAGEVVRSTNFSLLSVSKESPDGSYKQDKSCAPGTTFRVIKGVDAGLFDASRATLKLRPTRRQRSRDTRANATFRPPPSHHWERRIHSAGARWETLAGDMNVGAPSRLLREMKGMALQPRHG